MSTLNTKNCNNIGLTFDDVLLLPGYTDFFREEVSTQVKMHKNLILNLPVFSSPMDTVTEVDMAITMSQNGGVIHRSMSVENQITIINKVKSEKNILKNASKDIKNRLICAAAIGVGIDFEERIKALIESGVDLFVIDTAHGHVKFVIDAIKYIKSQTDIIPVMAGNITTFEAGTDLINAGADILRVGMGPGSICTTRIVTGVGVPQLTAISEVKRAIIESKKDIKLVADGGIKQIGDIAKAIAFGADAVMLGSMLAGFEQSPGEVIEINQSKYKIYRGMGSAKAMSQGSAARYGQAGVETSKLVSEGVEGLVKYKGDVNSLLYQIEGALKSSCYYIGGKNITEFQQKVKFVQITSASFSESMPHSITLTDGGSSFLR